MSNKSNKNRSESRQIYKYLINQEDHPDVLRTASDHIKDVFAKSESITTFNYTSERFNFWLEQEYKRAVRYSHASHYLDSGEFSYESVSESLFQRLPENALYGVFLARVGTIGPVTEAEAILSKIRYEELDNGNVFYDMVTKTEYKLFAVEDFADDTRLIDAAFDNVAFQLAISCFPKKYFPEILGMTMGLKSNGTPQAFPMFKILKQRGLPYEFYHRHIINDNRRTGHARSIKEAIECYLEQIRNKEGKEAMQSAWRRICQGYYTWSIMINRFERNLLSHLGKFEKDFRMSIWQSRSAAFSISRSHLKIS